jgi:hypothetical protein
MKIHKRIRPALIALALLAAACGPKNTQIAALATQAPTPQATLTPPPPSEPHGLYPDYTLAFNLEWGKWTVLNLDGEIVAVWDCPDCFERDE